jgi:uncharacterized protein with beta-barrel porin domain
LPLLPIVVPNARIGRRVMRSLTVLFLSSAMVVPALADGGTGGTVGAGTGGIDSATGAGGTGNPGAVPGGGGGGGGAGETGGTGGASGDGLAAGGPGGLTAGASGSVGSSSADNGGGGGGGAHGFVGAALPGTAATGGAGGDGGDSTSNTGGGGGGGAGGYGATITGTGNLGTLNVGLTGGNGGAGGAGSAGGDGGSGGIGVLFSNATGPTVVLTAPATGGNGGLGQTGQSTGGTGGIGGIGAQFNGASSNVMNSNTTKGGSGADGGAGSLVHTGGGGGGGGMGMLFTAAAATLTNSGAIAGGNGGSAGAAGSTANGGNGGAGVSFSASGATVFNNGSITGGNGGASQDGFMGNGGNGGAGGAGATFAAGGMFTNSGSVTGGNGARGGFGPRPGADGAAGAGVVGANLTVINSGTIIGGTSNSGVQANAVTFTGGTNVLELQAGSTITGNVVAFSSADTFRLGGTANSSFDVSTIGAGAQYRGFGVFDKNGTSIWTLTGTNAGALTWAVDGGTLALNGSMANATVTVNNGGTLGGTGVVGAITVNAGGILVPGNGTPGTSMTLSSLALTSGAQYLVDINPTTSSSANVTGAATLGGATVNAMFANGGYVSKQYTILTAGSVSGTFNAATVNTNLPSGFHTALSYDATDVFLKLVLNFVPPTAPNFGNGLSGNQNAVANTLINFFNTTGGIPLVFGTLTPSGLNQVSGETATGTQQTTFDAMTQFMNVMTDPFIAGRGDGFGALGGTPTGYASTQKTGSARDANAMFVKAPPVPFEAHWSTWVAGFGGSQTTDGNAAAGSSSTTNSIAGTAVGADYRFSPFTIAGFSLAGGGTSFSVAGSGSGHSDLFQAGVYARHTVGAAYISGALAYGWQDITTNRTLKAAGIDQLHAEFNANAYSGRVEGGYRFVSPFVGGGGIGITPYAAAQFTTFDLPAYAERVISGASNFALAYGAKDVTDTRSELGFRTDKSWAMQDAILTLRSRFAWAHDFNPDRSIAATFQTLPGASFVVNGAAQAYDSALTTASAELKWTNNWSVAATFEGEFSNVTNSYAGKGVVRYQW